MTSKPEVLSWHPGSYTLEYVLRNLPLPQVVQCDHTACGDRESDQKAVCGPPLLLYNVTEDAKVLGEVMMEGAKSSKPLVENGTRVVIPTEYTGWFSVHGKKGKKKHACSFMELGKLAETDCDMFLVGGHQNIKTIQQTSSGRERGCLKPGDVLKMGSIVHLDKPYLQCTDDKNNEVYIPMGTVGEFYVIKSKSPKSKTVITQIGDLVEYGSISRVVKLLCGPNISFSCWIKLTKIVKEPVVTASVVSLSQTPMLGIPKPCPLKFRIATLNQGWRDYAGYKDALHVCQTGQEEFRRSIKLLTTTHNPKVTVEWIESDSSGSHADDAVLRERGSVIRKTNQMYPRRSFKLASDIFWEEGAQEEEDDGKFDYEHSWRFSATDQDYSSDEFDDDNDVHDYENIVKHQYNAKDWIFDDPSLLHEPKYGTNEYSNLVNISEDLHDYVNISKEKTDLNSDEPGITDGPEVFSNYVNIDKSMKKTMLHSGDIAGINKSEITAEVKSEAKTSTEDLKVTSSDPPLTQGSGPVKNIDEPLTNPNFVKLRNAWSKYAKEGQTALSVDLGAGSNAGIRF